MTENFELTLQTTKKFRCEDTVTWQIANNSNKNLDKTQN